MRKLFTVLGIVAAMGAGMAQGQTWKPAQGYRLLTQWSAKVDPADPLPEYPRPQLVRKEWKNLNGLWQYAIVARGAESAAQPQGSILVPFCAESALSGVDKSVSPDQVLWYRRTFEVPPVWAGRRVLLHFGAVDWDATVLVNGYAVGSHKGGFDPFTFDITDTLVPAASQELVVIVKDATEKGYQPAGKQKFYDSGGIFYTPVTGIWQTVWIEPVAASHVRSLRIVPDVDSATVSVGARCEGAPGGYTLRVASQAAGGSVAGDAAKALSLACPNPKLWSPDSPYLYDLSVELRDERGRVVDRVESYFGMRKISLGRDAQGVQRLCLNNRPLFQFGPLDQGWWPDGLYTAPTDEALRYDLDVIKRIGFNALRKHTKVEPDRLYYWCDKLGILVWQDMPASLWCLVPQGQPDGQMPAEPARQFDEELTRMIRSLENHPSIVIWVPFNEGWGQHDTARVTNLVKQLDPSRLVIGVSGWQDRGTGDIRDLHAYPGPDAPPNEPGRAVVLGEFGGLGLPLAGHTWRAANEWGYQNFKTEKELTAAYLGLIDKLKPLIRKGLSAAIYTQITDVEGEVNGLMTYDRATLKIDEATLREANRGCVEVCK